MTLAEPGEVALRSADTAALARRQSYLWMLLGALAFAMMGAMAHALGTRCAWQIVAIARTGLALLFSGLLARAAGAPLVFFRPRMLWLRSLAGSVSLVGAFFSLARLPIGDVLTLTNIFPLWVALSSWPLEGRLPTREVWLAVACGIGGVVLIGQPHLANRDPAALVALACSVSTATAMLGLHRLQGIDARAVVVHFSGVALVASILALVFLPKPAELMPLVDGTTVCLLLGVGVAATVGQIALTKAFAAGPPAKVSVVGLTQVGFGIMFDVAIWHRSLSPAALWGTAMVIAPTAWLLLKQNRPLADEL